MKFEDYRSHAMRKSEQSKVHYECYDKNSSKIECTFNDLDKLRRLLNDMIENERYKGSFPKLGLNFVVTDSRSDETTMAESKIINNSTTDDMFNKDLPIIQEIDWGMHEACGE